MIFDSKTIKLAMAGTDEALIDRYKRGDRSVINELAERHKDLLKYKVNSFAAKNVPVPTPAVYGESLKILANTVEKFNPTQNVRFRTFLESNLRGLNRYVSKNKNILHFPENKMLRISKYKQVKELLTNQGGRPPADWQLADALGWSIPEVKEFEAKLSQKELAESGLQNVVGKEEADDAIRSQRLETAEFLYYSLTPEKRMVYDYALGRHGKPRLKTDAQISTATGLTPSKVNRIRLELAKRIQSS